MRHDLENDSVLAMRDSGAVDDDETAEEEGMIRHAETGEIYQVVYEGGSKKAKVDRLDVPLIGSSKLSPETVYQFFVATPESEGGMQGGVVMFTTDRCDLSL